MPSARGTATGRGHCAEQITDCITAAANLPSPVEPEGGPTIGIDQNRGRYEAVVCTGWTGPRRRGKKMSQWHPTRRRSAKLEPTSNCRARGGSAGKGRQNERQRWIYPATCSGKSRSGNVRFPVRMQKKARIGREDGTRRTIRGRCICASVTGDRVGSLTSAVSGVQVCSEALSTTTRTRRAVTSLLAGMTGCVARRISTHRIFPSPSGGHWKPKFPRIFPCAWEAEAEGCDLEARQPAARGRWTPKRGPLKLGLSGR